MLFGLLANNLVIVGFLLGRDYVTFGSLSLLSQIRLSSVTFVLKRLKLSAMFLRHFIL